MRFKNCSLAFAVTFAAFSTASPTASAGIVTSYLATDVGTSATNSTGSPTGGSLSTGVLSVGNFTYSLVAATNDPGAGNATTSSPGSSTLSNVTLAIKNDSAGTDTLRIDLTAAGYTLTGALAANFALSGSSSQSGAGDTTTGRSEINAASIPTVAGTTLTGLPTAGFGSQPYAWSGGLTPPLGNSNVLAFSNATTFSESQHLDISLGAGHSVTLTFNTTAVAVPEPTSIVTAGLGSIFVVGYSLWRRRRRTVKTA